MVRNKELPLGHLPRLRLSWLGTPHKRKAVPDFPDLYTSFCVSFSPVLPFLTLWAKPLKLWSTKDCDYMVEDMSLEGVRENQHWMKSDKEELFQSSTVVTTINNKVIQKRERVNSQKAGLFYFWNWNIIQKNTEFSSSLFSLLASQPYTSPCSISSSWSLLL